MRQLFSWVMAAGLLSAALGCHHTAGFCDCGCDECCGGGEPAGVIVPGHETQILNPVPLKELPQGESLESPKAKGS